MAHVRLALCAVLLAALPSLPAAALGADPPALSRSAAPALAPNLRLHIISENEHTADPALTPKPASLLPWSQDHLVFVLGGGGLKALGPERLAQLGFAAHYEAVRTAVQARIDAGLFAGTPVAIDLEGSPDGPRGGWQIAALAEEEQPIGRAIELAYIETVRQQLPTQHIGFFHDLRVPRLVNGQIPPHARDQNTANIPVFSRGRLAYVVAVATQPWETGSDALSAWWLAGGREAARVLGASDLAHTFLPPGQFAGTIVLQLTPLVRDSLVELPLDAVIAFLEQANTVALEHPTLRVIVAIWIQWTVTLDEQTVSYDGWRWVETVAIPAATQFLASHSS